MTKQTTTMAGAVAVIAIIAAAVLLGILPQVQAAATSRSGRTETEQSNELLKVQAIQLAEQAEDLEGLEAELDELRSQIPDTADLASVTRVIVNALEGRDGSNSTTLVSITPRVPPIAFEPRPQLTPEVVEPEVPQYADPRSSEEVPAGTFQEIPLTITATAGTVADAFLFIDKLNAGPRLLAVHHVQISRESNGSDPDAPESVSIAVAAAAYLQPSAQGATSGS